MLERKVTAAGATLENTIYGYAGPGDSPAWTKPKNLPAPVTTYIKGPNGLLTVYTAIVPSYPLANLHGDVIGNVDAGAVFVPNPPTDEFGVGITPLDRLGWHGAAQRYTADTVTGLIRMGVRLYDPALGRFLEVDPVEGGSCNDFDYACGDPINGFDLTGTTKKKLKPKTLSQEEMDALANPQKADPKVLKRARLKLIYNEKAAGARNIQKRQSQFTGPPTTVDSVNLAQLYGELGALDCALGNSDACPTDSGFLGFFNDALGGLAVVIAGGGALWWAGKLLSPLCGPAAPICVIEL